ncbi:MAG: ATP-dependent Clp protease ATP-binding subunit [Muribaculaceae bacterium]|nr:ATP-dependent Clp protease ATP-binding subunit [Muribaculaceae bacterium]
MSQELPREINALLNESAILARKHYSFVLKPEFLLLAMYKLRDSGYDLLCSVLSSEEIDEVFYQIDNALYGTPVAEEAYDNRMMQVDPLTNRLIKLSILESRLSQSGEVGSKHILLAFLRSADLQNTPSANTLREHGVTYQRMIDLARPANTLTEPDEETDEAPESNKNTSSGRRQNARSNPKNSGNDTPMLDKFAHDMTQAASEGRLDPVVGREVEIERLAQVLSRRKKNNPVLIGEPGVGKSAIVEGLALRIVKRQVPRVLFNKRVVSLDLASLIAGTKYRGEFEERIKTILNELTKNPDIILFIDEIHTIVGAGNPQGAMDAANLLKPALARGELQCIGATTLDEYRKNIEKDGALERRFQKVMVEPTTAEETLVILNNTKDKYEAHHNVTYTDDALSACVKLTDRYVTDRNFPDKAIDALDEAGSRVHISNIIVPENIEDLEKQIEEATSKKLDAARAQDFEKAAMWRDRAQALTIELDQAKKQWESTIEEDRVIVDADNVAEVVAMMTGVPVQRVAQAEGKRLLEMGSALKGTIIGQDKAVEKVVKAIQRNRIGLKDPNKPIGTFMFLGPTGVGKTHLAKKLSEYLFDSTDSLIRIDMSEYMEKFTVSRLVGAPPGYVGYEEGGQLTEKVRRHPYSIVLLDEIEKAHPDVFNLLLQVMDEGRLTDSLGRRIDFKNTIIIMTSNIGVRQLRDFGTGVGFSTASNAGDIDRDKAQSVLHKALNKAFAPEFLNRIDDIIMFDSLDKEAIFKIIDVELSGFFKRVESLGYKLTLSDEAKNFVAEKGYDSQFGARPLKRAIQKYLEDELAELIISANVEPGSEIIIDYDKEADKIVSRASSSTQNNEDAEKQNQIENNNIN